MIPPVLWRGTRGYRLAPWRSPYVRWRIETYLGTPSDEITAGDFWHLVWAKKWDLLRFVRWAWRNA